MSAAVHQIAHHQRRSPQLENGYTRIATELLEALSASELTKREFKVVLAIIRKTYGYAKKEDDVSASQLGKICGMSRPHVTEALNSLARKNVISKRSGVHGCIVSIQKDYSLWVDDPLNGTKRTPHADAIGNHYTYCVTHSDTSEFYIGVRTCKCLPAQDRYLGSGSWPSNVEKSKLTKLITGVFDSREEAHAAEQAQIQAMIGNPLMKNLVLFRTGTGSTEPVQGVQENDVPSTEPEQVGSTDPVPTIDNLPIDKVQKKKSLSVPTWAPDEFEQFWRAYPNKASRKTACKHWDAIRPDADMVLSIVESIAIHKKTRKWREGFVPQGDTFLSKALWEDEVPEEYSQDELTVLHNYNEMLGAKTGKFVEEEAYSEERAQMARVCLQDLEEIVGHPERGEYSARYFAFILQHCPPKQLAYMTPEWVMRSVAKAVNKDFSR